MPAATTFLDTNILIYYATNDDIAKRDIAAELLKGTVIISVQVLNEFTNVMRNKRRACWPDIRTNLDVFKTACAVTGLTPEIQTRAVEIAERHQFHIYDANIIAAAEAAGADILYSEDLQAGQRFGDMEVVNPYG